MSPRWTHLRSNWGFHFGIQKLVLVLPEIFDQPAWKHGSIKHGFTDVTYGCGPAESICTSCMTQAFSPIQNIPRGNLIQEL